MEPTTTINADVLKLIVVIAGVAVTLLGGGGLAAVLIVLRRHGGDVERAYQSTDPKTQATILGLVNTLNGVITGLADAIKYAKDVTDGDPNTPALPSGVMVERVSPELIEKALPGMKLLNTGTALSARDIRLLAAQSDGIAAQAQAQTIASAVKGSKLGGWSETPPGASNDKSFTG